MKKLFLFSVILLSGLASHTKAQIITTIAGGGSADPGDGGAAIDCKLDNPAGVIQDTHGNTYFCDRDNNRVRKIDAFGIITTIAGTGATGYSGDDGPATDAKLKAPYCIAIDNSDNIYIGDGNYVIRKINSAGVISAIAGTGVSGYNGDGIPATAAQLGGPSGIAFNPGGELVVVDIYNNRIRKIDATGTISTIAGTGAVGFTGNDGPATAAQLYNPAGLCFDTHGNLIFSDSRNHCVRMVNPAGIITTIAGTGTSGFSGDNAPATAAMLNSPIGVAIDRNDNVYVCDAYNNRIRKIEPSGLIKTFSGNGPWGSLGDGGAAYNAWLQSPVGIYINNAGNLYFSDMFNGRIRLIRNTVGVSNKISPSEISLAAFPNPNSGHYLAELRSNLDETATIAITNVSGQRLNEMTIRTNVPTAIDIDVPSGVYIMLVTTSHGTISEKICILN